MSSAGISILTSVGGPQSCVVVSRSSDNLVSTVKDGELQAVVEVGFRKRRVVVVLGDSEDSVNNRLASHHFGLRCDKEGMFTVQFGREDVAVACVLRDRSRTAVVDYVNCIWTYLNNYRLLIDAVEIAVTDMSSYFEIRDGLELIEGYFPLQYLEDELASALGIAEESAPDNMEREGLLRKASRRGNDRIGLNFTVFTSISGPKSCIVINRNSAGRIVGTVKEGQMHVGVEAGFRKRGVMVVLGDSEDSVNKRLASHHFGFRCDKGGKFTVQFGTEEVAVACVLHDRSLAVVVDYVDCIWQFLRKHRLLIDTIQIAVTNRSSYFEIRDGLKLIEGYFPFQYLKGDTVEESVPDEEPAHARTDLSEGGVMFRKGKVKQN
jgi:hypothetical protein